MALRQPCIAPAVFRQSFSSSLATARTYRSRETLFRALPRALRQSVPPELHNRVPDYPYGPRQVYKQSNFGLYGGARIRFGNNVSEDFGIRTRRKWKPNIQEKRLWSNALQRWIRVRISTRVLRTVDKVGGLDEYLLGEKPARLKELGPHGWMLRWLVMQTPTYKQRAAAEREKLGLPAEDPMERLMGAQQQQVDEMLQNLDLGDGEEALDLAEGEGEAVAESRDVEEATKTPQSQAPIVS